jgi:hypothetical protein
VAARSPLATSGGRDASAGGTVSVARSALSISWSTNF